MRPPLLRCHLALRFPFLFQGAYLFHCYLQQPMSSATLPSNCCFHSVLPPFIHFIM